MDNVHRLTEAKLKKRTTTTTSTRTDIREALEKAQGHSTHENGEVLGVRPAVQKKTAGELELRGQNFEHTRALLAMIEQEAIEALRMKQPAQEASTGEEAAAKAEILALLRNDK